MHGQSWWYNFCLVLVSLLLTVLQTTKAAPFDCYVCSYTRSSDPTVNYECVNKGNTSITRACQKPYMCKTLVLYNQGMTHIRSVTRDCLPQTDNCAGVKCCNMDGLFPLCEQKCRTAGCNDYNAESWLKQDSGDKNTDSGANDPNNAGVRPSIELTSGMVIAFTCTLTLLKVL